MIKAISTLAFCIATAVFAFRLLPARLKNPARIGAHGEKLVSKRLRRGLPQEYLILDDVFLPLPDGTTTQIDHVVISQFGVFVIETKTYSGWIFADEKSAQWTQTIYRKKSRFQNPLRQNYRHICALADNLGIDKSYFLGVVAFTGECRFKTEMPRGVVYSKQAARFILGFKDQMIKVSQVKEIADAILEWQATLSEEDKAMHVVNLRQRHSPAALGEKRRCPRCGGEMILRTSKTDGKSFYGCAAYPKCRGIVNIK